MVKNQTLYQVGLSATGALLIGGLGLAIGAVWGGATGADMVYAAIAVGLIAAVWGAICVQLTPTGGVIMENRTTVNYAVLALHGWLTFLICALGLLVWVARTVLV